jgi:hypothetical protein
MRVRVSGHGHLFVENRVGGDSDVKYLVLQVHYSSIEHISPLGDDSGVFLEYTDVQQPKVAGVLLLGTAGMAPARSTTFFESACEVEDPRQIHPFAFRTHTHRWGRFAFYEIWPAWTNTISYHLSLSVTSVAKNIVDDSEGHKQWPTVLFSRCFISNRGFAKYVSNKNFCVLY